MPPKTTYETLTFAEKHDILQKLNGDVSGIALAVKYDIGTSSIFVIKKNE